MSISLKNEATKFFDLDLDLTVEQKECFINELEKFCISGKKEDAFSVYYCYCDIFKIFGNKNTLQELVRLLSDHEYHSGELLVKHRDHFSHSVYVFLLGLAIYVNNKEYRESITKFYKNFTHRDFLKSWGMVGLFHDIGYPFQLAHEQIGDYMKDVFGDNVNPYVCYRNMSRLNKLSKQWAKASGFDATNMNQFLSRAVVSRLTYVDYNELYSLLKNKNNVSKFLDHGYFSVLLLANKLQEGKVPLDTLLMDSLSAILIHNSVIKFDISNGKKDFPKLKMELHPLAYLIMLCDEIQCWNRESFGVISKKDPLAWKFDISFGDNSLNLTYFFDPIYVHKHKDGIIEYANKNLANALAGKDNKKSLYADIIKGIVPHFDINISVAFGKKEKLLTPNASSNLLLNLEKIAIATHSSYMENFGNYASVCDDFNNLSLFYKLDNINQAKSLASKLEEIDCFYSEKELDYEEVKIFTDEQVKLLATLEHIRWVRNRIKYGWTYGKLDKDYTKENRQEVRKHQSMVPYGILPLTEKEKDLIVVDNTFNFLEKECRSINVYKFKDTKKPTLIITGTGHRNIDFSNPEEVKEIKNQIKLILENYMKTNKVVLKSNFACGGDLLIIEVALELGIFVDGYLPFRYEEYLTNIKEDSKVTGYPFTEQDERKWRNLIAQCVDFQEIKGPCENAYEIALRHNLDQSHVLIALWDGNEKPLYDEEGNSINRGGTYHSINFAKQKGIKIHAISCRRIAKN